MEHCINKELIEKLRDKINHLETKIELAESNIETVKTDIKDMKSDIKEISKNMENGFRQSNIKNSAMLTGIIMLLIGVIIDIATR